MTFLLSLNTIAQPTYNFDKTLPSESRQFDFWIGEWDVNLRQQQENNTWNDWKKSIARIYPILDGKAILELWEEQSDSGPENVIIGYSLRYFDPEESKWILWLNWPGKNQSGSRSLSGKFRHGRGEFYSERPINDSTTLISRYSFSDITSSSLRWDNGNSTDGGKTWTSSWIMEFSRKADQAPWEDNNTIHTFRNGDRCDLAEFEVFELLAGNYNGSIKYLKDEKWVNEVTSMKSYKALGGCAVFSFIKYGQHHLFSLNTFNTYINKFESDILDNGKGTVFKTYFGDKKGDTIELI